MAPPQNPCPMAVMAPSSGVASPVSVDKKAAGSRQVSEFEDCYGMVAHYMREMQFEKDPNYDYHNLMDPRDKEDPNDPAPLDTLRRYVKQIRHSFGFDVDCYAPSWFNGCFLPVPLYKKNRSKFEQETYDAVIKSVDFAIAEINADLAAYTASKTRYELVELERAVTTRNWMILLTLKVKPVDDDGCASPQKKKKKVDDADNINNTVTIQAMVYEEIGGGLDLDRWRFKPA